MKLDDAPYAVRSWLGIPYATADRFRSPAVMRYDLAGSFDEKGHAPLQAGDTSWLEADSGFSEDCLNLNVWAPVDAGDELLPVVVYIYGGGFELGANTQTTSNVSGLAATGRAIGVSLNYRLGPFGWLSLSQYGGSLAEATNLGLQDIIAALRWLRENIFEFGGDPSNVTVTGHSGGAYAAVGLLSAPSADGLYHRLAAFSGGASRVVPAWWAEELAHRFLLELGIEDDPEQVVNLDGMLLAETLIKISPRDIGERHGVDNTTIGVVDDHTQPGAVLTEPPLRVLESGRHRNVDILFSSATHEADWWVINSAVDFDPGSIGALVAEFATRNRIPRSRARKIVDRYNVNGRTPIEVRCALFTDYFFTLPAARGALAHAAAGGSAHLLSVGPVDGAHAVHGTEMYGIVGQQRPDSSQEQIKRDTFVRDTVLALASGRNSELWEAVSTEPTTRGVGNPPGDPTTHALDVLDTFHDIERT